MSGMHLLPVYYSTTNNRKRKQKKKTASVLEAERQHEKFLKKMGIGSRSSVGLEQRPSKPWVTGSSPVESTNRARSSVGRASGLQPEGRRFDPARLHQIDTSSWTPCTKEDNSYKLDISNQYVIGQAYNKGGLQVLSKTEQSDPTTGKRR